MKLEEIKGYFKNEKDEYIGGYLTHDESKMLFEYIENKELEYANKLLKYKIRIQKAIEYCELNKEFTPRLIDIIVILKGEDNESLRD